MSKSGKNKRATPRTEDNSISSAGKKQNFDTEVKSRRYSSSTSRSSARQQINSDRKPAAATPTKKSASTKKSRPAKPRKVKPEPKVLGKYQAFKQKGRHRD